MTIAYRNGFCFIPRGAKSVDKVFHRDGGTVYHRSDEKDLNREPDGVRFGKPETRTNI